MQRRQLIPVKENIPEGFSFKKKKKMYTPAGLFLPSFWGVCVFLSGIPLAIVFLVSFPFCSPKELEQERRLRPSDQTQVQSGMPLIYNGVCSCQFSRAPWAACKAILQLSCWHETAFPSPHCQMPSAARFSSLSLRKQNGLSSVR